ncbi:hypothetical protein VE01_09132 [Pseudogymnoascus verrucosus]|uniref:Uncharacterized protein n=1 Tax=Pseudogymnoascus verrucosus TaxID=342668 RepID=A0A1B8GAB9_9PEZI|nr:uncharacterized protein VE01_09132 [Pseudogymnoascus verrucosus]OBT92783.1 hypothetical protein VE01_09132 [Pseudogymnoascus verrucosus]
MASSYLPRFAAISAAADLPGHNRLPVWVAKNEKSYLFIALECLSKETTPGGRARIASSYEAYLQTPIRTLDVNELPIDDSHALQSQSD